MTPELDDIAPRAVPVLDGQLGMLDDWMTEPTELDQRRGYTRVSLATVNDDTVGRGGMLPRTIMRSLDQCTADNDAKALALVRQAEADAIAAHRKAAS